MERKSVAVRVPGELDQQFLHPAHLELADDMDNGYPGAVRHAIYLCRKRQDSETKFYVPSYRRLGFAFATGGSRY